MNILELANSSSGRKVDIGCGDLAFPGFEGYDYLGGGKDKRYRKIKHMNLMVPTDPALVELKGSVGFACCRHTLCCLPRMEAVAVLSRIRKLLVKGGLLLLIDFDLEKVSTSIIMDWGTKSPSEIAEGMGPLFMEWMGHNASSCWGSDNLDNLEFSSFYNMALRGVDETYWRYTPKELVHVLTQAKFSQVDKIELDDPRAVSEFTHTRPKEDQVFLCTK